MRVCMEQMHPAFLETAQEMRMRAEQPCGELDSQDKPRTAGIGQGVV